LHYLLEVFETKTDHGLDSRREELRGLIDWLGIEWPIKIEKEESVAMGTEVNKPRLPEVSKGSKWPNSLTVKIKNAVANSAASKKDGYER